MIYNILRKIGVWIITLTFGIALSVVLNPIVSVFTDNISVNAESVGIIDMRALLRNPNRVQANGFNSDGTYYEDCKLFPQSVRTETSVDYTISSHTNGEFYYNGSAEGFCLNFTATQASDPWENGTYNASANNDILFIVLRSVGNGVPWSDNQGYIFMFQRAKNATKTATKCTVYEKTLGSYWDENLVGTASWYDGDIFDGKTRELEVSAVNNADNTGVTLKMAIDGNAYFNEEYYETPLEMEHTGFKIVDFVTNGTGKDILFKFTDSIELNVDYTTGTQLMNSGNLTTDYQTKLPARIADGWAYSDNSMLFYNGEISAVDFDIVLTNADSMPSELALYLRANGAGTLWDNSQGYIARIQGNSVTVSKTVEKYTSDHTTLASGIVENIFDGNAHNVKFYAVDALDGKVYGGISIDGGDTIAFVDVENPLSITDTNFKITGVNEVLPCYKIGKYVPHTHEYSTSWSCDENAHWNACACGDIINWGEHNDNDDHKCDVCLKVLSECMDKDLDYSCDICGEMIETPPASNSEDYSSTDEISSSEEDSSTDEISSSEEDFSMDEVSSSEDNSSLDEISSSEDNSSLDEISSSEEVSTSETGDDFNDSTSSDANSGSGMLSNEESVSNSTVNSSVGKTKGCGAKANGLSMVIGVGFVAIALMKSKRKDE